MKTHGDHQSGFLEMRSRKRELLAEQERGWAEGNPASPEKLIQRWPVQPHDDTDVASILIVDLLQRRMQGEDASIEEYSRRFPDHKGSLAELVSRQDFLRSLGHESSIQGCLLRFPEIGDELLGFRLRSELGKGAFARVFLAEQAELGGRSVAVKISAIEGSEPQTLAQMQHTHIMPIYSVQEDQSSGLRAVCMPYFGGASLARILQELWTQTKLPMHGSQLVQALSQVQSSAPTAISEDSRKGPVFNDNYEQRPRDLLESESYVRAVAWIVARLAEGLQHAHQRKVLHRDIKPANILIGADGQPMLLDFNLAHYQNQSAAHAVLGGTVAYMAPEHLRAMSRRSSALVSEVDHRADIYSLGMVLYEMLTGHKPFEQSASYSVMPLQIEAMAKERSKAAPSLRLQRPDTPWSLESIIRRCLAPNPDHRYQQAGHLAEDLRCFRDHQPLRQAPELSAVEAVTKWTRRHPRLTSAGTVTLIAALLLLGLGATLMSVRQHLTGTQEKLSVAQSEQRMRSFDAGIAHALCLVNDTTGLQHLLPEGVAVCEQTLALYGILESDTWQEPADWLQLSEGERSRMAENARELLLLVASARERLAPRDVAVSRQALKLLELADAIPGLPRSRAVWLDRARCLEWLGETKLAAAAKRGANEIAVASARDHYLLATSLLRAGGSVHNMQAIASLDQALALDPRHYWAWLHRGIAHTELGDFVLAAGDFGHCTGLWPDFAWGHFNLAYVLDQSGEKVEAVQSYANALEHDPKLTVAHRNRGMVCLELKRYSEALDDLDKALVHWTSDAPLRASQGMALEALGRHTEADASFRLAFAQAANLPASRLVQIRWTYGFAVSSRLPAQAQQAFEESLQLDPLNKESLYGLAMLAMKQEKDSQALQFFNRALEASPHFSAARRYRAVLLARGGSLEKAKEDINWCLEKEPRSGDSLYAAACVAALASRNLSNPKLVDDQALDFLEKAFARGVGRDKAEHDPDLASIREHPRFQQMLRHTNDAQATGNH